MVKLQKGSGLYKRVGKRNFICFPLVQVILYTVCVGGKAIPGNAVMLQRNNLAVKSRVSNVLWESQQRCLGRTEFHNFSAE